MRTKFNKAPLPFLGQKRNFVKTIRTLDLASHTVIDLFGGSGLLSHTIKEQNPSARVIYNDFDNYHSRLDQVSATEALRLSLKILLGDIPKDTRPDPDLKAAIIDAIKRSESTDWITISSWLLFSGNYAHSFEALVSKSWYLRIPSSPICAAGYLDGVERSRADFRDLIDQFSGTSNVMFVADPPYIMTNQSGYLNKDNHLFRLKDSIDLIKRLQDKKAIYFSSPKSESDALFDVFTPDRIEKLTFESSIGAGTRSTEYLFLLNF